MKKKFLNMAIIISLLLSNSNSQDCLAASPLSSSLDEGTALMMEYKSIVAQNQQLLLQNSTKQAQAIKSNSKIIDTISQPCPNRDEIIYPEYFGGTYLNENKELVVCLTNDEQNIKSKIINAAKSSDIHFKIVDDSYNDLCALQDMLNKTFESAYDKYIRKQLVSNNDIIDMLKSISNFSIINKKNCIEIGIENITDKKITSFQKVFGNNDNFTFINSEQHTDCSTWAPGRAIYNNSTGSSKRCSTGYRAKYITSSGTTYTGFVSCAHGGQTINTTIYTNYACTDKLGTVKVSKYMGSVDASFITITKSNYSVGMQTHYGKDTDTTGNITIESNTYYDSFVEDSCLYKCGSETGTTSGIIHSANATVTSKSSGITLTNTIETSKFCDSGDSGGIVFYYNPSTEKSYACGVVHSTSSSKSNSIKASAIISALNVTPY